MNNVGRIQAGLPSNVREMIPAESAELISLIGDKAVPILEEISIALANNQVIPAPPLRKNLSDSGVDDMRFGILSMSNGKSYRPDDALSYDTIDDMLNNGQVLFTLAIKQAAIHSVLRGEGTWRVRASSERTRKIVEGMMARIFRTYGKEFMEFMPYGAAFFEKEWAYRSAKEWGVEGVNGKLYGYSALDAIHPSSIDHIQYKAGGHSFDGFVQRRSIGGDLHVGVDNALVLTYDKKFRNLWGNPSTDPMYPYWFWLEVAWRSFLRYLERTGTPVTVVYAPSRGQVLTPDGTNIQSMKYALIQAGYISKSNAAAFPSDVDPDTKEKLWRVEYLQDQARGDQFIKAIEALGTQLARSAVIGDMAATQTGSVGSRASADRHWGVTQLHNQMILDELLGQANRYIVSPIVLYNRLQASEQAYIEAQTLDQDKLDRLYGLLNTMGNVQGSTAMERIDWDKVLEINDVPVLSEEDIEKARKEKMDHAVEQQEAFAKVAEKTQAPLASKESQNPAQEKVKQSAYWPMYQLQQGQVVPMYITDEQAEAMLDRAGGDETVFDMGRRLSSNEDDFFQLSADTDIDKIVDEVMSEIDTEDMADIDIEDLRKYILGLLGVADVSLESDEVVIELGLRDILAKAFKKAKEIVNKVVKKITGKSIGEWKKSKGAGEKYKPGAGTVVTRDGRIWDPKKHPRDAGGRWASSASSGGEDDLPEEEGGGEDVGDDPPSLPPSIFASESWSEANSDGIKAIEMDGYQYQTIGDIDPALMEQVHAARLNIDASSRDLGYPLEHPPLFVMNWEDKEGALKYIQKVYNPDATMDDLDAYVEETGGQMAHYDTIAGIITIDSTLARESIETFETVVYHETLHAQARENPPIQVIGSMYDPDEIYTTLLTLQYAEENDLPRVIGYPVLVSWAAQAAIEKGMSKDELYKYALEEHKKDGGNVYAQTVDDLVEGTSVYMYEVDDGWNVTWDRRIDALEAMWPGWESEIRDLGNIYGMDGDELMSVLLMEVDD